MWIRWLSSKFYEWEYLKILSFLLKRFIRSFNIIKNMLFSPDSLVCIGFGLSVFFYRKIHSTQAECKILSVVSGPRRLLKRSSFLLVTQFGSAVFPSWERTGKALLCVITLSFYLHHTSGTSKYLPSAKKYCLFKVAHPQLLELCEHILISMDIWDYPLQNTKSLILILKMHDYQAMALCLSPTFILDLQSCNIIVTRARKKQETTRHSFIQSFNYFLLDLLYLPRNKLDARNRVINVLSSFKWTLNFFFIYTWRRTFFSPLQDFQVFSWLLLSEHFSYCFRILRLFCGGHLFEPNVLFISPWICFELLVRILPLMHCFVYLLTLIHSPWQKEMMLSYAGFMWFLFSQDIYPTAVF